MASYKTVMANHCAEFIAHDKARTGIIKGNPIHTDMVYGARKGGLAFICNVVIDSGKKVVAAFSGEMEKAHEAGCEFMGRYGRSGPYLRTSSSPATAATPLTRTSTRP